MSWISCAPAFELKKTSIASIAAANSAFFLMVVPFWGVGMGWNRPLCLFQAGETYYQVPMPDKAVLVSNISSSLNPCCQQAPKSFEITCSNVSNISKTVSETNNQITSRENFLSCQIFNVLLYTYLWINLFKEILMKIMQQDYSCKKEFTLDLMTNLPT